MIPVDLTFDVGHKSKDGKCKFAFFGINYDFFDDPNHQATNEELIETDLLSDKEFDSAYDKVVRRKRFREEANCYINSRHEKVFYYIMNESNFKRIILQCNGEMKTVLYDDSIDDDRAIHFDYYDLEGREFIFTSNPDNKDIMKRLNDKCKVFIRYDKSSFMLRANRKERNVISHDYITFENQSIITIDKIYSDDDLTKAPKGYKEGIANFTMKGLDGAEKIKRVMNFFRTTDIALKGFKILAKDDVFLGNKYDMSSDKVEKINLPKSNVIKYYLNDNMWFVLRPSGTEPKLKVYYQMVGSTEEECNKMMEKLQEEVKAIVLPLTK
jgi:hypothetical protein